MIPCQNCGKFNEPSVHFCRFCGTRFTLVQTKPDDAFDQAAPGPYAWKSDEFRTHNEARRTSPPGELRQGTAPFSPANPGFRPAPLVHQPMQQVGQAFVCPHCMSRYPPRVERRISTAGWITFAVLLVFFFPLFWIGLLIKEDVQVCQSCNTKIG